MGRLIELLVVVALALTIWRLVRELSGSRRRGGDPRPADTGRTYATARCSQCGTHVPQGELDASGRCTRCRT